MGEAFGLSSSLRYFEYEFDSQDAIKGYSASETVLDWPNFQIERPLSNIAGLKILEVQIPFSFYVINEYNNKFTLTSTSGTFTVTIPEGNYESSTLIDATQAAMFSVDPLGAYVIKYDQTIGKFTFYSPILFSLTFGTANDSGDDNPAFIYGFHPGTTPTGLVLQAPRVAAITGPMYLYVCSEALGTLCQLYLPQTSDLSQGGLGPELSKIPVNVNPWCIIHWQDPDPEKYFDVASLFSLQSLDLYLTLGKNPRKPLRLNGLSFSVKLGILVNQDSRTDVTTLGDSMKRIRTI